MCPEKLFTMTSARKNNVTGKKKVSRETLHHELLWKIKSKQKSWSMEEHEKQMVSRETLHHEIGQTN